MSTKNSKVLIIAAHPDDAEIAMGMKIRDYILKRHNLYLVICSEGKAPLGNHKTRKQEAVGAAKSLGVRKLKFLGMKSEYFWKERTKLRKILERIASHFRPDIVYSHFKNDQHPDHRTLFWEVLRASRSVPNILLFHSPLTRNFRPNYFFFGDEELLKAKIKAIGFHKSQLGGISLEEIKQLSKFEFHRYFHHLAIARMKKEYFTALKGLYCESFFAERMVYL